MEKVIKSVNALKFIYGEIAVVEDRISKDGNIPSKDRQIHCNNITDAMVSNNLKYHADFNALLAISIEVLLQSCADDNADVRLSAEECLNRLVKGLFESHISKIILEFFKEIKKNGHPRSLKAAITRFASLSFNIRPSKCRPYMLSLLPCLVHVSQRYEEIIQEALAPSISKIFSVLGSFANEGEIQSLIASFLKNLSHSSVTVRRSAGICLHSIIASSLKINSTLMSVVESTLDILFQRLDNRNTILGCLQSLRLLSQLFQLSPIKYDNGKYKVVFIKILMSSLYYICHTDNTIVTSALELLEQLLKMFPFQLEEILRREIPAKEFLEVYHLTDVAGNSSDDTLKEPTILSWRDICASPVDITKFNEFPITKLAQMLCQRFLFSPQAQTILPDSQVRVSTKTLTINCMNYLITIEPLLYHIPLHHEQNAGAMLSDFTCYLVHSDPKLRGSVLSLLAHYLSALITLSSGNVAGWYEAKKTNYSLPPINHDVIIEEIVGHLVDSTTDDATTCLRQSCTAVSICGQVLLRSQYFPLGLSLYRSALSFGQQSYWLLKVDLLELLSSLNFRQIAFLEMHQLREQTLPMQTIQRKAFSIIFSCLSDDDTRVRKAAAAALVATLEGFTFFDNIDRDYLVLEAQVLCRQQLSKELLGSGDDVTKPPEESDLAADKSLLKTYRGYESSRDSANHVHDSLSLIVAELTKLLARSTSRYLTQGCLLALKLLSFKYPPGSFPSSWCCHLAETEGARQRERSSSNSPPRIMEKPPHKTNQQMGLLPLVMGLLNSPWLILDMNAHSDAMLLASNLLAGTAAIGFGREATTTEAEPPTHKRSSSFSGGNDIGEFTKKLFTHLVRQMSICHHVVSDLPPASLSKSLAEAVHSVQSVLPTIGVNPTLPSPIKKKDKKENPIDTSKSSPSSLKKSLQGGPLGKANPKKEDGDREKPSKKTLGSFSHNRVLMKLHGLLLGSYKNYKGNLEFGKADRFCSYVSTILDVMCQLLEMVGSNEVAHNTEEILIYLKTLFTIHPTMTVRCVQLLLKSLFGTNLLSQLEVTQTPPSSRSSVQSQSKENHAARRFKSTLSHQIFHLPLNNLGMSLVNSSLRHSLTTAPVKEGAGWFGAVKKKVEEKLNQSARQPKSNKMSIQNYIRLFEPLVIKALKMYTVSSSMQFQERVLNLLAQLVQLRVNYNMLDSDQIFINYVIKQFESIETGLIRNSHSLIPHVFFFLVLLTYEFHHSKHVIGMSKVIQLCDGLMASGHETSSHVIPALDPIVHDLFVVRATVKTEEISTQREFIFNTLLKLAQSPQVLEMIAMVLRYYRLANATKWKSTSQQVVAVLLPLLKQLKINIKSYNDVELLNSLFESLSPATLRPTEDILSLLLSPHPKVSMETTRASLAKVLVLLRYFVSNINESDLDEALQCHQVVAKMKKMKFVDSPPSDDDVNADTTFRPLARFLHQVVCFLSGELCGYLSSTNTHSSDDLIFLVKEFIEFLLLLTNLHRTGVYKRLTSTSGSVVRSSPIPIDNFLYIARFFPLVTLMWSQLLAQLGVLDLNIWSSLTGSGKSVHSSTLEERMVYVGSVVLLCDYVCQSSNQHDLTSWILRHHLHDVIALSGEAPVEDFLHLLGSSTNRTEFLAQISSLSKGKLNVAFLRLLISFVGTLPESYDVLEILLSRRFIFSPVFTISRSCDRLACDIVESLLARDVDDSLKVITLDGAAKLTERFVSDKGKRFTRLRTLLARLKDHLSGIVTSPLSTNQMPVLSPPLQQPSKTWLKTILLTACKDGLWSPECARVLSRFEYDDVIKMMSSKSFCCHYLDVCLAFGISECVSQHSQMPSCQDDSLSSIMKASRDTLVRFVSEIVEGAADKLGKSKDLDPNIDSLCGDEALSNDVMTVCACLSRYFHAHPLLPQPYKLPASAFARCIELAKLSCQVLNWGISHGSLPSLSVSLACFELLQQCLKIQGMSGFLCGSEGKSIIMSVVDAAYSLVCSYVGKLPSYPPYFPQSYVIKDSDKFARSCIVTSQLFDFVCRGSHLLHLQLPHRLVKPLHSVVLHLCRTPLLNSYIRIPRMLWKYGWDPPVKEEMQFPEIPPDYLQEKEILIDYICIINHTGWVDRTQFEETWAGLLGVLVSQPIIDGSSSSQPHEDAVAVSSIAVRGLTSLVINSALQPQGGAPATGRHVTHHRHPPVKLGHIHLGRRLLTIRSMLREEMRAALMTMHHCEAHYRYQRKLPGEGHITEILAFNTERVLMTSLRYGLGQVSTLSFFELHGITPLHEDEISVGSQFESSTSDDGSDVFDADRDLPRHSVGHPTTLTSSVPQDGVDVHSCVQFLLDLYSGWLRSSDGSGAAVNSRPLLCECVRSLLLISDMFTQRHQFEWMLNNLSTLHTSQSGDDDVMLQYVVGCLCKAAAVLGMSSSMCEVILPLIEMSLASPLISCRTSALYGALYCLESYPNSNMKSIVDYLMDYLAKEFVAVAGQPSFHNEDFVLALASTSFLLIERCHDVVTPDFVSVILQASSLVISEPTTPSRIYHSVAHGLERLVIVFALSAAECEAVLKMAAEQLRTNRSLPRAIAACALMVTCMYCGRMRSSSQVTDYESSDGASEQDDVVESRLIAMERVSILFERIRRGHYLDARILIRILPQILHDFFPPAVILNKVIAEFVSSLQPFPDLLALLLHQVFQHLHSTDQSSIVNEWVILSLSNVIQRTPVSTAVWCLTCLFIAASTNHWVNSLLPILLGRMKQPNPATDWPLLCEVAVDFYNCQLQSELDRRSFHSVFAASREEPYLTLVQCIAPTDGGTSTHL